MATLRRVVAGMVQMTSVNDVGANFARCSSLVSEAASKGCKIVFLPEWAPVTRLGCRHASL